MVRLWTWEAFAHGAEVVSYFRWRQVPFAQEQMHAGLHRPDYVPDIAFFEVRRVAEELAKIPLPPVGQAPVALVYDPEAPWVYEIQPQGAEWNYMALVFLFYSATRQLGLDVDVLPPGASLEGYKLVLVPSLPIVREAVLRAFREASGIVLFGPRSGSKTEKFQVHPALPPGPLQALLPLKVVRVESLPPGLLEEAKGLWGRFPLGLWREWVETNLEPLLRFEDGWGALFRAERYFYLAAWPTPELLGALLGSLAQEAGLSPKGLPQGLRLRRRGHLVFAFNYGPQDVALPAPEGARFLLGGPKLLPYEVAIWEEG